MSARTAIRLTQGAHARARAVAGSSASSAVALSPLPSGMKTYVALLRGINLGSRKRVAMADLRALVESLGAEDVATYVQSGNVVFKSADGAEQLTRAIERRIKTRPAINLVRRPAA